MSKIVKVNLPDIGEGVMEGEVLEWLKHPNESVEQDEPVVIVMTDKATVELPAPYPGKLHKQYCQVGQIAIRDKPLYELEVSDSINVQTTLQLHPEHASNEKIEIKSSSLNKISEKRTQATQIDSTPCLNKPITSNIKLAAPPTRKLAHMLEVDINNITGSGEEGRVLDEDVIKYHAGLYATNTSNFSSDSDIADKKPTRFVDDEEIPVIGIRNLMAKKMAESKKNIPHFSYFEQTDATHLVQLRHNFKESAAKQGISVTYMPFIIKALSMSLKQYPWVNSSLDTTTNTLIVHKQHNIGIAITTEKGLIVPVLKNAQDKSLIEIIEAYEVLKNKALSGKLQSNDMKESTITISNFGVLGGGGLWATPIINFPEVAILAIAKIQKMPMVKNSTVVVRDVLNLSWSFDHRIIDGDMAASFSHHFSMLLQNPAPLL